MIDKIDLTPSDKKIKVLALCDYVCTTGFGTVAKNIMQQLAKSGNFELCIVAINYDGMPYDYNEWPGTVIPAMSISNMQQGDVYGRQRFLDYAGSGEFDVVFMIQDTFIIQTFIDQLVETQELLQKKFATVLYYPFDCTPKNEWVEKVVAKIDYPVAYTDYAKSLTLDVVPELEAKLQVIYHGNEPNDFHVVKDRDEVANFRKQYFSGKMDDRFMILNVNRNQPRKDIIRNFMILNELRKRGYEEPALYLHMAHNDSGGNVLVMADHFGLEMQKDYFLPSPKVFDVNRGLGVDMVNMLYNTADIVLTTTLGEGWGLSMTEAMATETPIVAPDNTSLSEMLADNRGLLVPSGNDASMWIMKENDNERLRPLMDVVAAADAIEHIINGDMPDIKGAATWVSELTWENICKQWIEVFERAAKDAAIKSQRAEVSLSREQRRAEEKRKRKEAKRAGVPL